MALGFHELCAAESTDVYAITPEVLRAHLQAIGSRALAGEPVVTFDDAHESQVRLGLPVLAQEGVRAMFFVPTAHVGSRPGTATWPMLRKLVAAGHLLGSHSHSHALLTHCSPAELARELRVSRAMLEDQLGVEVSSISLPGGRGNGRVLRACAEAGYRRVYTSEPGRRFAEGGAAVIGRLIVRRTTPAGLLTAYLDGDAATLRRLRGVYGARRLLRAVAGDALYGRVWRARVRDAALTGG